MFNKDYFDFDLFDDVFDPFFAPRKARSSRSLQSPNANLITRDAYMMKTDIEKTENGYEMSMDLPGFDKNDISVETKNGYLTISATKSESNEQTDKDGKNFIHKERFYGKTSRSFYIGSGVNQNDIKASYTDGVLKLIIPEAEAEQKKMISIE